MASDEDLRDFLLRQPVTFEGFQSLCRKAPFEDLIIELFGGLSHKPSDGQRQALLLDVIAACLKLPKVLLDVLQSCQLWPFLISAALSPNVKVRRLLASQLHEAVSPTQHAAPTMSGGEQCLSAAVLIRQSGIWDTVPQLILDEDVGIAETAIKAVERSVRYDIATSSDTSCTADVSPFVQIIFSPNFFAPLLEASKNSRQSVRQMRILALSISLGKISSEVFNRMKDIGLYDTIFKVYESDDILMKLNCLELINEFGTFDEALNLLSSTGVPKKLVDELDSPFCDDTARVAILNILAKLITDRQEDCGFREALLREGKGKIVKYTEEYLFAINDVTKLLCGLNVWGSLVEIVDTLQSPRLTERAAELICHPSTNEVCIAALHAWTVAVTFHSREAPAGAEEESGDMGSMDDTTRTRVVPNSLKILQSRPFAEVRSQVYMLLAALSPIRYSVEAFMSSHTHLTMLQDFRSESTHEARVAKHLYVSSLLKLHGDKPWLANLAGHEALTYLKRYAAGGPFYAPPGAKLSLDELTG